MKKFIKGTFELDQDVVNLEEYEEKHKRAIKEFAERLKDYFCESCSTHKRYHLAIEQCREKEKENPNRKWCFKMRLIDNLVKEMVGEDNNSPIVDKQN